MAAVYEESLRGLDLVHWRHRVFGNLNRRCGSVVGVLAVSARWVRPCRRAYTTSMGPPFAAELAPPPLPGSAPLPPSLHHHHALVLAGRRRSCIPLRST